MGVPVFPFRSRYCGFLGKAHLLQWDQAILLTTSCLA